MMTGDRYVSDQHDLSETMIKMDGYQDDAQGNMGWCSAEEPYSNSIQHDTYCADTCTETQHDLNDVSAQEVHHHVSNMDQATYYQHTDTHNAEGACGSQTTWYEDHLTDIASSNYTCDPTNQMNGVDFHEQLDSEDFDQMELDDVAHMRDWDYCEENQDPNRKHDEVPNDQPNDHPTEYTEYSKQFNHEEDGNV